MRFVNDLILWAYWNPFKLFIQKIAPGHVYMIGRVLGAILYHFAFVKRRRLLKEACFISDDQNKSADNKRVVQAAFRVFTYNELEVLLFPVLNEKNISSFVSCVGLENLDIALSHKRGAILLFAHFGANQMVMPAIGYRGYKICQLSAPATVWEEVIPDRVFSRMEVRAMQKRWEHELSLPVTHINIFGSLRKAFLCLKRNGVLGIAIDGGWGRERAVFSLLNKSALFPLGPADIARRIRCAILPTFMVRDKKGRNKMIIEPALKMDESRSPHDICSDATQRFVNRLEIYLKEYPSHYINFLALRRLMASKGDTPLFLGESG